MISSVVREMKGYDAEFCIDIETVSVTGQLLAIGICRLGHDKVDIYDDWIDIFDLFVTYKRIRIWAHNGFRFDHLYLLRNLAERGELEVMQGIFDGGNIHLLSIRVMDVVIDLGDSFQIFQTSLMKVGESYSERFKKVHIDCLPEVLYVNDRNMFNHYLRMDVLTLSESLSNLLATLNQMFTGFGQVLPGTVGSLAMRIFRMNLPRDIITSPRGLDKFERSGYFGGLVGCRKIGFYECVSGIDVNSMYPSVMVDRIYPVSYLGYWTYTYQSSVLGIWECCIRYPVGYSGVCWIYDAKNRCLGSCTEEFTAILDTDTIDFCRQSGYRVTVMRGYVYLETSSDMFGYMRRIYDMKNEGGARRMTAKYVLNSTYGKFGQKHERTRMGSISLEELYALVKSGVAVHEYDFGVQQIYSWHDEALSTCTFCIIALLVTSRARLKLYQAIKKIEDCGMEVLYYDTDSVHFRNVDNRPWDGLVPGLSVHETELGAWGIQFTNAEAGYAGKKLYFYNDRVKAKGVCGFTLTDMCMLIREGQKSGSYISCTSTRDVLFRNKEPGLFTKHERQLSTLKEQVK